MNNSSFYLLLWYGFFILGSYSHSMKLGECPRVPVLLSFDMNKFAGDWYVIQRYNPLKTCTKITIAQDAGGDYIISEFGRPLAANLLALESFSRTTRKIRPSNETDAMFSVNRVLVSNQGVLDTDYSNFAIMWGCTRRGLGTVRNVDILSRRSTLKAEIVNEARLKLENLDLEIDPLKYVDHKRCTAWHGDIDFSNISDKMLPPWTFLLFSALFVPAEVTYIKNGQSIQTPSLTNSISDFAFALHKNFPKEGNVVFSPWSVSFALGMVCLGASGTTLKEMQQVLSVANIQPESLHYSFKVLREHLVKYDNAYVMNMFSTILIQERKNISPVYKVKLRRNYDADIHEVDFVEFGPLVKEWVNVWTSLKTGGKIQDIMLDVPNPNTVMLLLSASYFKGVWVESFNSSSTYPSVFYNANGEESQVDMMYATRNFSSYHGTNLDVFAVDIPMKGEVNFMFIMPLEARDFEKLQSNLSTAFFRELHSQMSESPMSLGVPKFSASSKMDLRDSLYKMGMKNLFTSEADLSQITADKSLYVEDVVHKASLDVNEEGAVATSVTVISIISKIKTQELIFNRPFIFVIRDIKSGVILFMGRISQL